MLLEGVDPAVLLILLGWLNLLVYVLNSAVKWLEKSWHAVRTPLQTQSQSTSHQHPSSGPVSDQDSFSQWDERTRQTSSQSNQNEASSLADSTQPRQRHPESQSESRASESSVAGQSANDTRHSGAGPNEEGAGSQRRYLRRIVFPGHVWLCPQWQLVACALVWSTASFAMLIGQVRDYVEGRGELSEIWGPMLFSGGGLIVATMFGRAGYLNYMLAVQGQCTQGRIEQVQGDPTVIVNGVPITRITYSYSPEPGGPTHDGYVRTFNSNIIERFTPGQPVAVMYDPALPHSNVAPALYNVAYVDLGGT